MYLMLLLVSSSVLSAALAAPSASPPSTNDALPMRIVHVDATVTWPVQESDEVGGYVILFSDADARERRAQPNTGYVKLIGSQWTQYTYSGLRPDASYDADVEMMDPQLRNGKVIAVYTVKTPKTISGDQLSSRQQPPATSFGDNSVTLDSFAVTVDWKQLTVERKAALSGFYVEVSVLNNIPGVRVPFQHIKVAGSDTTSCRIPSLRPNEIYTVSLRGAFWNESVTNAFASVTIDGGEIDEGSVHLENTLFKEKYATASEESALRSGSKGTSCDVDDDDGEKTANFQCRDNNGCIPFEWVCDGVGDCPDSDDEWNCPAVTYPTLLPTCQENEFACKTKHGCINSAWVCDGENDCSDGSDEDPNKCHPVQYHPRPCAEGRFRCPGSDNACLPAEMVCDGDVDCVGGADEENCALRKCNLNHEFSCAPKSPSSSAVCVPLVWVCDGDPDCPLKDDESPTTCANSLYGRSQQ